MIYTNQDSSESSPQHGLANSETPPPKSADHQRGTPSLDWTVRRFRSYISICSIAFLATSCAWPIAMFFILKDATNLDMGGVFSISLATHGLVQLYTGIQRHLRLWKPNSGYQPIGQTSQWAFDAFQWSSTVATTITFILLVVGSVIPSYAISSLPLAVMVLQFCAQLVFAEMYITLGWRAPFRISSVSKGEPMRPGVYTIVEDVIAVDGGGSVTYRQRWNARYLASQTMRTHLRVMDFLWGGTGFLVAGLVFAVACIDGVDGGLRFVIGWAVPWIWVALTTLLTVVMTRDMLRREACEDERKLKTSGGSVV